MADVMTNSAKKVLDAYEHSRTGLQDALADSEKAMRYVVNQPYTAADKARAKEFDKPLIRYPVLLAILSNLQGNEQLNRRRGKIKSPSLDETVIKLTQVMQGRWNALNDEQDIEEKLQVIFLDALITKLGGWIQRDFKINDMGYLDFEYTVLNNMRVFPDPEFRVYDYQLKKCHYIVKEGWESLETIKAKYGSKEEFKSIRLKWYERLISSIKRFVDRTYTGDANYDEENDLFKVLEMQERVPKRMWSIWDGSDYMLIEPKDWKKLKKDNPQLQKIGEDHKETIHITTIIPKFSHLVVRDEDIKSPVPNFDVFPMFSYALNIQSNEAPSLMDLLLDIQDDINKGQSQIRDHITQLISGGWFVSAFEKETIKQMKVKGNQPGQVYPLQDFSNVPVKKSPDTIPPEFADHTREAYRFSELISQVTASMKGQTERSGESGVLFAQKVERAAAAINPFYKGLANCRKTILKDFVDHIPYVYSELNRVLSVKQDDKLNEELINIAWGAQVLNDVRNVSFKVELDEGQDNVTVKEESFNSFLALTNVVSKIQPEFVDVETLVKKAPIDGKDEWVLFIQNQKQLLGQQESQQRQFDTTKQQLENMEIERGMQTDEEKMIIEASKVDQASAVTQDRR